MMGRWPMMHGFGPFGSFRDLQVAVPVPDGQWLAFATALPESGPSFSRQFLLSMGIMAAIILAVSVWAVRRVTTPLAALSAAAERLGNDLNAPPMAAASEAVCMARRSEYHMPTSVPSPTKPISTTETSAVVMAVAPR